MKFSVEEEMYRIVQLANTQKAAEQYVTKLAQVKENQMEDVKEHDENCVEDHADEEDCSMADDGELEAEAFDTAVAGLLKASEALDTLGFEKNAGDTLKLAELLVEAKKAKKGKKDAKKGKGKAKGKKKDEKQNKK